MACGGPALSWAFCEGHEGASFPGSFSMGGREFQINSFFAKRHLLSQLKTRFQRVFVKELQIAVEKLMRLGV